MSNSLVRSQLETGLQLGSLGDLVKATTDLPMLLIDASASMFHRMKNGRMRIEGLRDVVKGIKDQGQVHMIVFGGETEEPRFVDYVPDPGNGTPMHQAIQLAHKHGASRLVIISDGYPDLGDATMEAARAFGGKIDVVFVGDPGEAGSVFLDNLAKMTGGTRFEGSLTDVKAITGKVVLMLTGDVEPAREPIQGPGFVAEENDDLPEPEDDDEEDDEDEEDDDDDRDDE